MSIISRSLHSSGYRSLRDVRLEIGQLTVVTGANGSGKSSLYRALRLLADVAQGRIIQSLALEGGLQSVLWAGPEAFSRAMKAGTQAVQGTVRKNAVSLKLGFSSDDYGFAIDLGLPLPCPPSRLRQGSRDQGREPLDRARCWDGPTPSPSARARRSACATRKAHGARS